MSNKDKQKVKFNTAEREFMFTMITEFHDSISHLKDEDAIATQELAFGIALKLGKLR